MRTSLLLAPLDKGIIKNRESWLCPPNSFQELLNGRVELGYITSKKGNLLLGTIPSKKKITGIGQYIGKEIRETLVWDENTLYKLNVSDNNFTVINTTPFSSVGNPVQWEMWNSPKVPYVLYFTFSEERINGMWAYNGSTVTSFSPSYSSIGTIIGGKKFLQLGGRLLIFSPTEKEGDLIKTYKNRVRWSAIGDPTDFSLPEGGYADAATGEDFICAATVQDYCIVCFGEGVWCLDPLMDVEAPFQWRRLEGRCKAYGLNSIVSYPTYAKILGERGLWGCDGRQLSRIDEAIPYFVSSSIRNTNAEDIICFQEYFSQTMWNLYAYTNSGENSHALIYDDLNNSFSVYEANFSILGYGNTFQSYRWSDFSISNNKHWKIGELQGIRLRDWILEEEKAIPLAGDYQGNIYKIDFGSLNQTTIPFTTYMKSASWNPFVEEGSMSKLLYVDIYIDVVLGQNVTVNFFKDNEESFYKSEELNLLPYLGYIGNITNLLLGSTTSVICPNHGLSSGERIYIYECKGTLEANGGFGYEVEVIDENTFLLIGINSTAWNRYEGGGKVYLNRVSQEKTWKRIYGGGTGFLHHIEIYVTGLYSTYFKLHAIKPYFEKRGKRLI